MDETDEPARVGLTLAPSNAIRIPDLVELVRLAEGLGYHSVWLPETWGDDAVSLLAVLAISTTRIKLASGVLNVYSRSAGLIAQSAATLQNLSGGRFILGLGASGPGVIERWHGIRFERPVERTRQYVEVVRLALSGQRVDYETSEATLSGFRLSNPPAEPVPIYVAALGPRNVRLVGRIADGWLPIFAPRGGTDELRSTLARGAADTGRDLASIDIASFLPALAGSRGSRLLRQQLAYYVGGMGTFYAAFLSRAGYEQDVSVVRDAWQRGDRRSAVDAVSDRMLALCTLGDEASEARERLDGYRAAGIGLPIVALPHGCTREEARETIVALAPEAG